MIVSLGWGSLIWRPEKMPISGQWQQSGPHLPIEFARQSDNGRMTLVIAEGSDPAPVLWIELDVRFLDEARRALAQRERIEPPNDKRSIGFWSLISSSKHREKCEIGQWAKTHGVDGVVWTALKPKYKGRYVKPSCDQVVGYLGNLKDEKRQRAEEYVRHAPAQIRTAYRVRIESELGWTSTLCGS